jgi:sporulation protein YlmC with PRC-barrel domain
MCNDECHLSTGHIAVSTMPDYVRQNKNVHRLDNFPIRWQHIKKQKNIVILRRCSTQMEHMTAC